LVAELTLKPDFADDARWLALLERLDEPQRRVVQLRFLHRRKLAEIAAELAIAPAEVARRLLLGLRELREAANNDLR
jgi:RNA polymerase sigma factor (sigma-70 family)